MTSTTPEIIPSPISQRATSGEKKVYDLLRKQLPGGSIAWYELTLSYRRDSRYADFVIISPDQGIIVLEVKDWTLEEITEIKRTVFRRLTKRREFKEHDPFKQARDNALLVNSILQASGNSYVVHDSGSHQGQLRFPYRHAVVLTNITRRSVDEIDGFSQILEQEPVLLKEDLDNLFVRRVLDLPSKFRAPMSPRQIDAVRGILYPEVKIGSRPGKVLDTVQEAAIKSHLSEEGERALGDPLVRLVRGPAGSGKSLILIKRADLEAAANPNWRILVLTYNRQLANYLEHMKVDSEDPAEARGNIEITNFHRWCRNALEPIGEWRTPVGSAEQQNLIRAAVSAVSSKFNLSAQFIAEEISWMKERELTSWEAYRNVERTGRGSALAEGPRQQVYQTFEAYQQLLGDRVDWDDVPLRVIRASQQNLIATGSYEAVFVDEAQDFAPTWFKITKSLVNPQTGILFLAADATQRIYQRGFTWKSLGLDVIGRTSVLHKSYRNPPGVQRLAYELIKDDKPLLGQLADIGQDLPEPDVQTLDSIDLTPIVFRGFPNENAEYDYLVSEIRSIVSNGCSYSDIAIFHRYGWGVKEVGQALDMAGLPVTTVQGEDIVFSENKVTVCTLHSSKGLEFPSVFICGLDRVNYGMKFAPSDPEDRQQWLSNWMVEEKTLLYVGMTRATERLFLTFHGRLPAFIADLEHAFRVR